MWLAALVNAPANWLVTDGLSTPIPKDAKALLGGLA